MSVSKVKFARVEKGLTQQELADIVNVTRQTISLIESNK
ncbi:helix-turn-helix domain-containing protein, partial [Bacillus thuringiensis]